jgi:hypothetical protein
MNRSEKIRETKRLVRELEISEQAIKQSLAVITSRKNMLKQELDGMGAASSAPRGVLSEKQTLELISGLTK